MIAKLKTNANKKRSICGLSNTTKKITISIGIRNVYNQISFLSNITQYVSVNGCKSDNVEINRGVPQGSVIGHIPFLYYINDLPNISSDIKDILFADDTNQISTLKTNIQLFIDELIIWLNIIKLSLNIAITKIRLEITQGLYQSK